MPLVENNDDDDDDDSCSDLYESDIVQSDNEHVKVRRPSRKLLTKNRLVHDINSSLNEECYDDIHFINRKGQWEKLTGYLGPKTNKNTKAISWTSDFPTQGRQRACDIINIGDNPGTLLGAARNIDTIENKLNFLFDDQMLDLLVSETNNFIERKLQTLKIFKEHLFETSKVKTSPFEMHTRIGFIYVRGLYRLNHHKTDILFNDKTGPPIFGAIFSRNRVNFLLASICFISRDERMKNFHMTIDETLYPMRHQIAFRQYNPNKPHKYGPLCKSLNDASLSFTYKTTPYAGKPTNGDGLYYIDCIKNYVKYLVNTTEKDIITSCI